MPDTLYVNWQIICFYSHFTDETTKAQKGKVICQGYTAKLNPVLSDFKAHVLSTFTCYIQWIQVLRQILIFPFLFSLES